MKNHVTERLPDYLTNELDRMQKAEVDSHLEECALCREEYDALLKLWTKLGTLPEEAPSQEARVRFYAMLDAYQEGAKHQRRASGELIAALNELVRKFWPREPVVQLAVALVLLIVGLIGGIRFTSPGQEQTELASLRNEVQMMGRLLTVSLLNQQSASERLRGVSWTNQIDQPDPQILTALMNALRYDSNVDVRLAAVDALVKFVGDPNVQSEMVDALPAQDSPLVQIALIDLMVEEGIKQSTKVMQKMSADPKINAAVKIRIEEGMKELSL